MIDAARTARELNRRLASLETELAAWRKAAADDEAAADDDDADAERPLRRHHTQLEAVTGTLVAAAGAVAEELEGADQGLWILERANGIDRRILDLHRLWGFFRDKLALRYVPWLERALIAADDFAWACYSPAQERIAEGSRREPPLVFFSSGSSPFLMPRGTPYVIEPLPDGGLREPEFEETVRAVPVPLIGLPWFQVDHLPDAPLIGHEVGHAVELDLELEDRVAELAAGAVPVQHAPAWRAWSHEAFADLFGVLCCGSGFVRALTATLAGHPRLVESEDPGPCDWGDYPTRTLRVLLATAALEELEIDGGRIAADWRQAYPQHQLAEYEDDARPVVKALMNGPYAALGRNAGLKAVMTFGAEDEQHVTRAAELLAAGLAPDVGGIRHAIAGARVAYEDSRGDYVDNKATAVLLDWIADIPFEGVRAAGGADTPDEAVRASRDEAAGKAVAALISRAAARDDSKEALDVPT